MKKILALIIITISVLVFGAFSILYLIDYNKVYQEFLSNIKLELDPKTISHVRVNKFPVPHIVIEEVKQPGKIELQNVEIKFSILSLIKFKPEIINLRIDSARVHLGNDEWSIVNHENLIADLISKGGSKTDVEISHLYMLDSQGNTEIIVKDFTLSKNGNFKGKVNELGEFAGSFNETNDNINFEAAINNANYNFKITEIYKNAKLLSGNAEFEIKNIFDFLAENLPDVRALFSKLSQKEVINVKFDIIPASDFIKFKSLVIDSQYIVGLGEIQLSKSANTSSLINLDFSKFDINSLILTGDSSFTNKGAKIAPRLVFANKTMKTEINFDQINVSDNEKFNKVKFLGLLTDGKFYLKNFSGLIEGGGAFNINGEIAQNSYRSIFDGKIQLTHNNLNDLLDSLNYGNAKVEKRTPFALTADLKCTVIDFYLQNILLKADNFKVSGNVSSKFIGSTPRVNANLNFSSIDLSKREYPLISPLQTFVMQLTSDMKDKAYLSKFIPIRTLPFLGNFDITFNDLKFGDLSFGKVNLLLNMAPSKIYVDNLYINKGEDYISTNLDLQTSGLKPELNIRINDGLLHVDFLSPKRLLDIRNLLLKEYSMDKLTLKVDGSLSKLYQNNLLFENVKFKMENDNILFKISDVESKVLSGNLKGEGSILLEPFTWNFVYALNSVDLAKLSSMLAKGLVNTVGGGSINGMLTTNGDTIEKLLFNLYAKSSLVLKNTKINNLSIDNFIEDFNSADYNLQNVDSDLRSALLTGQTDVNSFESNLELTKGVLTLKDTVFQTKYSSASLAATINIYNFGLNLTSAFSFYQRDKSQGQFNKNFSPLKLNVKATGTIFEPQKISDPNELLKDMQANLNKIRPTSTIKAR